MRNRRLVLLLAFLVLVGLALIATRGPREPVYKGKRLSELLEPYAITVLSADGLPIHTAEKALADEAFRTLGTNTLPALISWIQYDRPPLKLKAIALLNSTFHLLYYDKEFWRAYYASLSLQKMGPMATPALPELVRLCNDPRTPQEVSGRANDTVMGIHQAIRAAATNAPPSQL